MKLKWEFVCIVCFKEGEVFIDLIGKKLGWGVYLLKDKESIF